MFYSFFNNLFQSFILKTETYYLQNSFNASLRPTSLAAVIAKLDQLKSDDIVEKVTVGREVVLVNQQDQQEYRVELVYPPRHKPRAGRYSVISDLGVSLLGRSKGEYAEVNILGKPVLFMVKDIALSKK
ncbi:MAG: GreA/GreB family elongation factor [Shewanella sp.]|uniref:GreA/GreB family elongation factor n=1 Tax=Shewanella cutis TaxID=2766780 RepID=A0ABS9QRD6_9GAMM|nr:GreA/GreB family elongation factor [Shewanella sp. PS-2]MCG9962916.1 GreA/GreB family elongation factor [Shewanella sp. PS-2]